MRRKTSRPSFCDGESPEDASSPATPEGFGPPGVRGSVGEATEKLNSAGVLSVAPFASWVRTSAVWEPGDSAEATPHGPQPPESTEHSRPAWGPSGERAEKVTP